MLSKITSVSEELQASFKELLTKNLLGGGGIASLLSAKITLINSDVEDNLAGKNVFQDCRLVATGQPTTGPENAPFVSLGGGIFNYAGTINLDNSNIKNNNATNGGGIWSGTNVYLTKATIEGNKATNGAGIFNANKSIANLLNTTVTRNIAEQNGGGILNEGDLTFISTEITENQACNGGGIYSTGLLLVFDSEINRNSPNNVIKK